MQKCKRRCTRSGAWPDTHATIKIQQAFSFNKIEQMTVKGKVENLGASGMFLMTDKLIPVPGFAQITINFESDPKISDLSLNAIGQTVRLDKNGVGIKFTSINLKMLQKCIVRKINVSSIYKNGVPN